MATQKDIEMHRGDDRQFTAVVKDQAGAVVDLTGAALTWAISPQDTSVSTPQPKNGGTAIFSKTVGSGITITDAVNGAIQLDVASADTTAQKAPLNYYHELQLELGSLTHTVMFGKFALVRDQIAPGP